MRMSSSADSFVKSVKCWREHLGGDLNLLNARESQCPSSFTKTNEQDTVGGFCCFSCGWLRKRVLTYWVSDRSLRSSVSLCTAVTLKRTKEDRERERERERERNKDERRRPLEHLLWAGPQSHIDPPQNDELVSKWRLFKETKLSFLCEN